MCKGFFETIIGICALTIADLFAKFKVLRVFEKYVLLVISIEAAHDRTDHVT